MKRVLQPMDLVEALAYITERDMSPKYREALAVAIGDDQGVVRALWQPTFDVVLRSVLLGEDVGSDNFQPTLLSGFFQRNRRNRRARTKNEVISWLRQQEPRTGPKEERHEKNKAWRIPVPDDSTARVPLGGDIYPEDVLVTSIREDGVKVKWYTLRNVQIGEFVYRVDSGPVYGGAHADIRVTLYQRVGRNSWARVQVDGSYDAINLPVVLGDLAGKDKRFAEVARVPTQCVYLLRPPPDVPAQPGTFAKVE